MALRKQHKKSFINPVLVIHDVSPRSDKKVISATYSTTTAFLLPVAKLEPIKTLRLVSANSYKFLTANKRKLIIENKKTAEKDPAVGNVRL